MLSCVRFFVYISYDSVKASYCSGCGIGFVSRSSHVVYIHFKKGGDNFLSATNLLSCRKMQHTTTNLQSSKNKQL